MKITENTEIGYLRLAFASLKLANMRLTQDNKIGCLEELIDCIQFSTMELCCSLFEEVNSVFDKTFDFHVSLYRVNKVLRTLDLESIFYVLAKQGDKTISKEDLDKCINITNVLFCIVKDSSVYSDKMYMVKLERKSGWYE